MPITVFLAFRQVDLEDNQPEVIVCLIPHVMNVARRANKCIPGFGKSVRIVDPNDCLAFEDVEHFCLPGMGMQSLPGVRWNGHNLKQVTFFVKVVQGEDDLLAVIRFDDFPAFGGRLIFHSGSISNIEATDHRSSINKKQSTRGERLLHNYEISELSGCGERQFDRLFQPEGPSHLPF